MQDLGTTRERLAAAAFNAFAENGFDATTVDDIATAAGVSRRTFFRNFPTKEDVVFPDHERLQAAVSEELDRRRNEPPLDAVFHSIAIVLADYVANRDVSVERYALTREVPALRERELFGVHGYTRIFGHYLTGRLGHDHQLRAELMAAAVVAAHNATLRAWLRSRGELDAMAELESAFDLVRTCFDTPTHAPDRATRTTVAVVESPLSAEETRAAIDNALRDAAETNS